MPASGAHLLEEIVEARAIIQVFAPVGPKREMPSRKSLRESMPRMKQGSECLVREDRDAR
jgi:hypothetical protein